MHIIHVVWVILDHSVGFFLIPPSPPIKNQMDGLKISMRSIFLFEYKNDPMDSFII